MSVDASVRKLHRIRNLFTSEASREKLNLMTSLGEARIEKGSTLKLLHASLCFIRAFPDDLAHHRLAVELLGGFLKRVKHLHRGERSSLAESGIEGTRVHYSYSYPAALWLARHCPGSAEIDWSALKDTGRLDELLQQSRIPLLRLTTTDDVAQRLRDGLARPAAQTDRSAEAAA